MKYIELFPKSLSEGIGIISLLSVYNPPWDIDATNVKDIEQMYGIRSGFKKVLDTFAENYQDGMIVRFIMSTYRTKWQRLWDVYKSEYSAIKPHDFTESGEDTQKIDYGGKTTNASTGTHAETDFVISDQADYIAGFNSPTKLGVPAGTANSTDTDTRAIKTSDDSTSSRTGTDTTTNKFTHTKTGNDGRHTPQELVRAEIEAWKVPYFNLVFNDIDNLILCQVYD